MDASMRKFLEDKYGDNITSNILDNNQVNGVKDIDVSESRRIIRNINKKIGSLLSEEDIKNHEWAFDFPGGAKDFRGSRKIMVIGSEPHISSDKPYYQTTFSMDEFACSEAYDSYSKGDESGLKAIDGSSWNLWKRLIEIFWGVPAITAIKTRDDWEHFFSQFYLTDLCHFAPKGQANKINEIKNWGVSRDAVANAYLREEVEIVKPDIIVTQGWVVTKTVGDIFESLKAFDKKSGLLQLVPIYDGTRHHLSVGHLSSNQTANWWKENMDAVLKKLKDYKISKKS